jgi:hypothetical protein
MPNWCENELIIKADGKDSLEDFKKLEKIFNKLLTYSSESESIENLFESILPIPNGYLENGKWRAWCINNWGTKWDAVDCLLDYDPDQTIETKRYRMKFTFLTAWGPPIAWLEYLGNMFPDLWIMLEYNEPGMCFRGVASGRGEIIDNYSEY